MTSSASSTKSGKIKKSHLAHDRQIRKRNREKDGKK